jgi:intermediate peptidase
LAALDQVYHSSAPSDPKWNSTDCYYDVFERFAPKGTAKGLRESGTNWHVQFTHLVGYGASYYAYLFDRAIASQVWKQIFEKSGGLDREAGERYRKEVLVYGGGKDPWECLAALLENDKLARGGAEAMAEVGKWGIQEH